MQTGIAIEIDLHKRMKIIQKIYRTRDLLNLYVTDDNIETTINAYSTDTNLRLRLKKAIDRLLKTIEYLAKDRTLLFELLPEDQQDISNFVTWIKSQEDA